MALYEQIETAAKQNNSKTLQKLLKQDYRQDTIDRSLYIASAFNFPDIAKIALEHGANVAGHDHQNLAIAAERGSKDMVELLLEKGAEVDGYSGRALQAACAAGQVEIAEILLNNGADIHTFNDQALMTSIQNDRTETVEFLLKRGANPNAVYADFDDDETQSPLSVAVSKGNIKVVDLLIEHGADTSSAITMTIFAEKKEMFEHLLKKGIDPTTNNHAALKIAGEYDKSENKFFTKPSSESYYLNSLVVDHNIPVSPTEKKQLLDSGYDNVVKLLDKRDLHERFQQRRLATPKTKTKSLSMKI